MADQGRNSVHSWLSLISAIFSRYVPVNGGKASRMLKMASFLIIRRSIDERMRFILSQGNRYSTYDGITLYFILTETFSEFNSIIKKRLAEYRGDSFNVPQGITVKNHGCQLLEVTCHVTFLGLFYLAVSSMTAILWRLMKVLSRERAYKNVGKKNIPLILQTIILLCRLEVRLLLIWRQWVGQKTMRGSQHTMRHG